VHDELQQLSPTGQVVQSPFRSQLLQPLPSASVVIKREQPSPPPPAGGQQQPGQAMAATLIRHPDPAGTAEGAEGMGAVPSGGAGGVEATTHSPARVSCVSPGDMGAQQAAAANQLEANAPVVRQAESAAALPDSLAIVNDDNAVFRAMACLLKMVAASGHVPPTLVSKFRRSFGGVEPAGRRWFIYDSLQQLYNGSDWAEIQEWLQGE
jgi:hypothetical protein